MSSHPTKDFRILSYLGFGSFGEVKLACHLPTNTKVAVKVLEKKHTAVADNISEVEILQSLEHKNIVQFFHASNTHEKIYIFMEYVAGKHLAMLLRDTSYLTEEEARPIFQQVVSAVHYLHKRLIAHRDIKLENILIDRAGNIKLCDFGMSVQLKEGQMLKKGCGSLFYMAPEILARKAYDGLEVDMWSLGVVLYVLVTGKFPYEAKTIHDMYRLITKTQYPIPYNLSKPCRKIIAQLLTVPTWHRITIYEVLERRWLGHIKEHVEPASKEILPRVIETMCTIGYTCEEIVSSLRHWQPNDTVTATFNILKHKFSCGDSDQSKGKPWLNSSPVGALHSLLPLKQAASEPVFPAFREDGKGKFQEDAVEVRGKRCQSCNILINYSCLELMPCSDEIVHEGSVRKTNVIHSASRDIAINMNSVNSLPGDVSSCESALDGIHTSILNMDFETEQPSLGNNMHNVQPQTGTTTSGSRPFRAWKLMWNRIFHALRALCFIPEPLYGESWTLI